VTFDRAVTGVTDSSFTVSASGLSGAGLTSVNGSGTTRTVTVATGTGAGTLRLDLIDLDLIYATVGEGVLGGPGQGNGGFSNGEIYDVDNEPPSVIINQADVVQPDPTDASPIFFTAVFSESVSGFTDGDVSLSGTANPQTAVVTGGPVTYDVAVSGMTTNGTVIASIAAAVADDALGNDNLASTSTDNTVTYNGFPDLFFGDGFENP